MLLWLLPCSILSANSLSTVVVVIVGDATTEDVIMDGDAKVEEDTVSGPVVILHSSAVMAGSSWSTYLRFNENPAAFWENFSVKQKQASKSVM